MMFASKLSEGFAMNGGDGKLSYSINSTRQKLAAEVSKESLVAAVSENLDIDGNTLFRIADLGCSIGPNTFIAVKNLIGVVEKKYKSESDLPLPEFQAYFSDVVSNDFNHLFTNLPRDGKYFAAGVPGSFHGRLFPKASLDIVYSAYALQWLSKLPEEVVDLKSPTCNKGRILYAHSAAQVVEAYSNQYASDMQRFLEARSQELASKGLMVLLIPGRPGGTLPAQHSLFPLFEPVESSLSDMVNEGLISKDAFDTFNLPMYCPSTNEVGELIEKNGCFDVLRIEIQPVRSSPFRSASECRAGLESIIRNHFGDEIIEPLFYRYSKKVAGRSPLTAGKDGMNVGLFILLKRKIVD